MPYYAFTDKDGSTLWKSCSIAEMESMNGVLVHDGKKYRRDIVAECNGYRHSPGNYPRKLSIGRNNRAKFNELIRKTGISGVDMSGDYVTFATRKARKEFYSATGHEDPDAGSGDQAPDGKRHPVAVEWARESWERRMSNLREANARMQERQEMRLEQIKKGNV